MNRGSLPAATRLEPYEIIALLRAGGWEMSIAF
jgi:hypothetical protein